MPDISSAIALSRSVFEAHLTTFKSKEKNLFYLRNPGQQCDRTEHIVQIASQLDGQIARQRVQTKYVVVFLCNKFPITHIANKIGNVLRFSLVTIYMIYVTINIIIIIDADMSLFNSAKIVNIHNFELLCCKSRLRNIKS